MGEDDGRLIRLTTPDGDELWIRLHNFEYMYRNEEKGYTHIRFINSGISVKETPNEIFEAMGVK